MKVHLRKTGSQVVRTTMNGAEATVAKFANRVEASKFIFLVNGASLKTNEDLINFTRIYKERKTRQREV